jgi:hypothetical protein
MGNIHYNDDLARAGECFAAGSQIDIATPSRRLDACRRGRGIVTGTGCSFGVATLLAMLSSEARLGDLVALTLSQLAQVDTPVDFAFLITGRGIHPDAALAYDLLRQRTANVFIVCSDRRSPLLKRAGRRASRAIIVCPDSDMPKKTAFTPVGTSLFAVAAASRLLLSGSAKDIRLSWDEAVMQARQSVLPPDYVTPQLLHIFAPGTAGAAAFDLCNRLKELGGIMPHMHELLAFAHGGYRCVELSPTPAAMLFLEDPKTALVCQWLRTKLPANIPRVVIRTEAIGWRAALSLYLQQLYLLPNLFRNRADLLCPPKLPRWGNSIYFGMGRRLSK